MSETQLEIERMKQQLAFTQKNTDFKAIEKQNHALAKNIDDLAGKMKELQVNYSIIKSWIRRG